MTEQQISIYFDPQAAQFEFDRVCKTIGVLGRRVPLYDVLMGWWERRSNRDLVAFVDCDLAVKRVVEMGVGTGYLLKLLVDKYPEARVTGLDLSEKMLQSSRSYLMDHEQVGADGSSRGRNWTLVCENCRGTSAPDRSQDLVVSSYLLDLLPPEQIHEVVREIGRVLNCGGKAYLAILASTFPPVPLNIRDGASGLWQSLKAILKRSYFNLTMRFYIFCYYSEFLRKLSHRLFNGYYTHCRPIDLRSYIESSDSLEITGHRSSFITILGLPFLAVDIFEATRRS